MAFGIEGIGSERPAGPEGLRRPPARVVTNTEGDRLELSDAATRDRPRVQPDGLLAVGRVRASQDVAANQAQIRGGQNAAQQAVSAPRENPGSALQRVAAGVPEAAANREMTRAAREARLTPAEPPQLPGTSLDFVA